MKELRATILVGLLAVVSVTLVVVGVLNTAQGPGDAKHTYLLDSWFDDATGVAKGTRVTIAGFPVGQVEVVKLEGNRVRVTLRLVNEVQLYAGVKEGKRLVNAATVTRLQASLLGDYYLELTPGHVGKVLAEGDFIPIVITTSALDATLERLQSAATILPKIDQIAGDISKITANAAKVFGGADGGRKFETLAENLVVTSRNLARTSDMVRGRLEKGPLAVGGEFDEAIRSFALFGTQANEIGRQASIMVGRAGASAVRGIADFETVAKTVRELVGNSAKDVDSTVGNISATLKKLQDSLSRADRVLANVEEMTERTKKGEGTLGHLITNDKIAKDAEAMVSGAREMIDRFTGSEMGIDYSAMYYSGMGSSAADQAAPWRSQLTFRIQPNKHKYYTLSVSSDIRRGTGQTITSSRIGPNGQPTVETLEVSNNDDIKFGFQYVRRFGLLAVRGGLIESRAGGGIDLFALNDRIEFGADLFRLTPDRLASNVPEADRFVPNFQPRVRTRLLWHFLPFAYLKVGADEILVASRRDVFFGLGLNFTDNDLILLFASAPTVQFGK